MKKEELDKILELHKKWLNDERCGVKADLRGANLQGADLQYADLRGADLQYADLRGADLRYADLQDANLLGANLQYANLLDANLQYANLLDANLLGANLQGANIDFSCLPLWCGGLNFKIDEKQAKQLVYHVLNIMQYSKLDTKKIFKKATYKWLEDSHLVTKHNLPKIKE